MSNIILISKSVSYQVTMKRNMKRLKAYHLGFLGGAVVKNPPANVGDTGSSPGLGRSWTCHGATKPVRHNY